MTKKEHLFYLIKSLSKAEKRYFKLFSSTNNGSSNYLLLFDAIDKQTEYDERLLKKKFAGKKFIDQLHVTKNYLNQLILKSLRNFHSNTSKESELNDLLRNIEILLQKELFQQCAILIEKALLLAHKYEKWPDVLHFLDIKRRFILNKKSTGPAMQDVNDINRREREILRKMQNISDYWDLTINMFPLLNDPQKLKQHRLIKDDLFADSTQAKTLHHHILQALYFSQNDYKNARKIMEEIIYYWEENGHMIIEQPGSYLTILNNLAGISLQYKEYEYAENVLHKIRRAIQRNGLGKNNPIAVKAMLHTFNIELEMCRDTNQVDRGLALEERVNTYLNDKSRVISQSYRLLLYYQLAYLFYLARRFKDSLKYLNLILAGKYGLVREDIQAFANILFLIIHFELQNITLLKYAVESCRRFLKKKRQLQVYEKAILNCFSRLSTAPKSEYKIHFKRLQDEIFLGLSNKEKNNVLDYLNFEEWIANKLKT